MHLSSIAVALALAGIGLLTSLAALMVRRGFYRQFPFFFLYTCCSIVASVIVTVAGMRLDRATFLYLSWAIEAVFALTGLVAMCESFYKALRVYFSSRRWFFLVPLATVLIILSISTWALRRRTPVQTNTLGLLYLSFDLSADYMLAGLFGIFVILVFFFQTRWQRYPFGIMKGFGFFSIVGMLADLLRSEFGIKWDFFFSYAPPVAYILGCLIWLGTFLGHDESRRPAGPGSAVDLDEILELLSRLTKAIK